MGQASGWLIGITVVSFLVVFAFHGDEFWDGGVPEFEFSLSFLVEFLPGVLNILTVGVFDPDVTMPALTRLIIFLCIHVPWITVIAL
jgi:hypothetical protein